jgi:hypothetical protein
MGTKYESWMVQCHTMLELEAVEEVTCLEQRLAKDTYHEEFKKGGHVTKDALHGKTF